jgi:GNAT superfamily N-acetyltransferase
VSEFEVRQLDSSDRPWVAQLITARWGADFIVAHGRVYHCADLRGFAAASGKERAGLLTYVIEGTDCEIVSLDSLRPGIGIGSALIQAVKAAAWKAGCRRLWLTTTNDNLNALRFYQKRGFRLVKIHRDAVERARELKPIPATSADGISIRDEIELELRPDK